MPKQTIQQQLTQGLMALGYSHISKGNSRYEWFLGPIGQKEKRPRYIFVGKNGALRSGTAPSNSYNCTAHFRLHVLEASPKALASFGDDL